MVELNNHAHSVFLLNYHLILFAKYRRKVFGESISMEDKTKGEYCKWNIEMQL